MDVLKFKSPIPPSVNHYLDKSIRKYGNGYKGLSFNKTQEALIYENHMRHLYHNLKKDNNWETPSKNKFFKIKLTYFFDQKGKDPDNTLKLLLDCMTKNGIIPDDTNAMIEMQDIYIDSTNPRIEVELTILNKRGVFKSSRQYNKFLDENCRKCKRSTYKKNCGCLTKYLNNYITKDLDFKNMRCKNIKE